jgi:hypothetical protein
VRVVAHPVTSAVELDRRESTSIARSSSASASFSPEAAI